MSSSPKIVKLQPHPIAGARWELTQRRGLIAFDVGVGKAYTALAIIAYHRQTGQGRRPAIIVPGSVNLVDVLDERDD
jgi:hypothetical protein